MFEDIDFSPGFVAYDGTAFLDQEDIFQVRYKDKLNLTLDVGWYAKEFAVVVIKNYDWENPLVEKRCVDVDKLSVHVRECAEYIRFFLNLK